MALSALGTVSTRSGGSTGSMSRDISPTTMRCAARTEEEAGNRAGPDDDAVRTTDWGAPGRVLGAPPACGGNATAISSANLRRGVTLGDSR